MGVAVGADLVTFGGDAGREGGELIHPISAEEEGRLHPSFL